MSRFIVWLFATMLLALPAVAQDGTSVRSLSKGDFIAYDVLLCDGATGGATKTCAEYDLGDDTNGWPHHYVIEIEKVTDCSGAPAVVPRGFATTGATTKHDLVTSALTTAGTSAVVIDWPSHRFIDASVTSGDACTDLEVLLRVFYTR